MAKFWGSGKFPYTQLNNLNLDWIIKQINELKAQIAALIGEVGEVYVKPETGIPKSDLSAGVQASLDLADSALQTVPDTYRTAAEQDAIDSANIEPLYEESVLSGSLITFNSKAQGVINPIRIINNTASTGNILITGKNLLNADGLERANVFTKLGDNSYKFEKSGTAAAGRATYGVYFPARAGRTYHISFDYTGTPTSGNGMSFRCYTSISDLPSAFGLTLENGHAERNFTPSGDYEYVRFEWSAGSTGVGDSIIISNFQIEVGASASAYEAYKTNRLAVSLDSNGYVIPEDGADVQCFKGVNHIWSNIGNPEISVNDFITKLSESVKAKIPFFDLAPIEYNSISTREYLVNDFLVYNNVLYKVTAPINIGANLNTAVNIERVTIGSVLTALLNSAT